MSAQRHTPDRVIARIARRQHNLVTRGQLLGAGLTRHQIAQRLRRGTLWAVHRGVYAAGTDRLAPHGHWLAGVLACGDGAVLSHQSAAGLWGIGPALTSPVHVIVGRQVRRRPGLVPHRHELSPDDVTLRGAIRVTTPQRTIADLPRHLRDDAAIKARVLRLVDDGGPVFRSGLERRVHSVLAELGLRPDVNATVEGRERDLVWHDEKVVIEVDGPHHDHPAQQARDAERDRELREAGYSVRRLRAG